MDWFQQYLKVCGGWKYPKYMNKSLTPSHFFIVTEAHNYTHYWSHLNVFKIKHPSKSCSPQHLAVDKWRVNYGDVGAYTWHTRHLVRKKSLILLHYLFEKQRGKYFILQTPTQKEKSYHNSPAFIKESKQFLNIEGICGLSETWEEMVRGRNLGRRQRRKGSGSNH